MKGSSGAVIEEEGHRKHGSTLNPEGHDGSTHQLKPVQHNQIRTTLSQHLVFEPYNVGPSSYRASYILCNITNNITYKLCCQSYKSSNLENWTGSVITKSCQLANLDH